MLLKVLKDFADSNGFMSDSIQIWGRYQGYQFTIGSYGEKNTSVTLFSSIAFADPGNHSILDSFFTELKNNKIINDYRSSRGTITLTISYLPGSFSEVNLQSLLDQIVAKYQELSAETACFNCHQAGERSFARYNGVTIPVCDQCYAGLENKINRNMNEHNSMEKNYGKATIGAFLGALLGSAVWVIVGLLGYFAAIAGFAISYCAEKGYILFKGKINRVTPWIIGISSVVAMVIAQFVTYDLIFYREMKAAGLTLSDALSITFQLPFVDPEITSAFVKDTLLGLVFVGLGAFSTIRKLTSMASRPAGTIERV